MITNDDLALSLDTTHDWIVERTGIERRHEGGTTSSLAIEAGRAALKHAGIEPDSVDGLILATTTPDRRIPATASAVQDELRLRCGAVDVNAVCSGFVYALILSYGLLSLGARRLLVIGADVMSQVTDHADRTTAILFADGAGAFVLEASSDDGQLLGWDLDSDGSSQELLYAEHGGFIQMNGKEVFRRAVRLMVESAERALTAAGVSITEVALLVPHQANRRIIEVASERLGVPLSRTAIVVNRTGNTSSASVPIALADAADTGKISRGDIVLFTGFGAGMTAASAVLRWTT